MNSTSTLQGTFKNERDKFLSKLESYVVLDIGTIQGINEKGRATVVSSTFMYNKPVVYEDVEIIYPGNANGTFAASGENMACLIFIPRSCMPNIDDLKLNLGATSYNKDGVKAMPIGNSVANTISLYYSDGGLLSLNAQLYSIDFTEDTIVLQNKDGSTTLTMDGTGQLYLTRQTNTGTLNISIEDTGITKEYTSQNKDVTWTDTLNPDGSRTFVQSDNQENVLSSVTIGADGAMTVHSAADVSVSTEGDANVQADGDVAIDAESIKLNGDDRHLVAYEDLKDTMDTLYTALTTTNIAGDGSPQPTWTGLDPITKIDISKAKVDNVVTGAAPTP